MEVVYCDRYFRCACQSHLFSKRTSRICETRGTVGMPSDIRPSEIWRHSWKQLAVYLFFWFLTLPTVKRVFVGPSDVLVGRVVNEVCVIHLFLQSIHFQTLKATSAASHSRSVYFGVYSSARRLQKETSTCVLFHPPPPGNIERPTTETYNIQGHYFRSASVGDANQGQSFINQKLCFRAVNWG